jgi:hypothetical protein
MQHMFKRNLQKEQKIIENDKFKNIFSVVFKVTVYMTPKIQNVLMSDRPMQIWDTNDIENNNGKHENFKLGSCVYELLMSKLIDYAYEKFICL